MKNATAQKRKFTCKDLIAALAALVVIAAALRFLAPLPLFILSLYDTDRLFKDEATLQMMDILDENDFVEEYNINLNTVTPPKMYTVWIYLNENNLKNDRESITREIVDNIIPKIIQLDFDHYIVMTVYDNSLKATLFKVIIDHTNNNPIEIDIYEDTIKPEFFLSKADQIIGFFNERNEPLKLSDEIIEQYPHLADQKIVEKF